MDRCTTEGRILLGGGGRCAKDYDCARTHITSAKSLAAGVLEASGGATGGGGGNAPPMIFDFIGHGHDSFPYPIMIFFGKIVEVGKKCVGVPPPPPPPLSDFFRAGAKLLWLAQQ